MNLLEHYIKEVHSVKEVQQDWGSFILVDLTADCYGTIKRTKTSFRDAEEWEKVQELGYYMA
mgnify:CR=1 FL=1